MTVRYGLDTNVLIAIEYETHPRHNEITFSISRLIAKGADLCFTPQNLGEFWNVSTRPLDRNGFGLLPWKVLEQIDSIERKFTLLAEDERVYGVWKRLLITHNVRGIQVHDAHLAAVLEVHAVPHLLTFNTKDFQRFPLLAAMHPAEV